MFSTSDRYPTAAGRWLREARSRRGEPLGDFLKSVDLMIYFAGAALATWLIAIVLT